MELRAVVAAGDVRQVHRWLFEQNLQSRFKYNKLLKLAISRGHIDAFHELIECRTPVSGPVGSSPDLTELLYYAARMGDGRLALILLNSTNKVDVYNLNEANETPLHVAAKHRKYRAVEALLKYIMEKKQVYTNLVDNDGLSIFHILCMGANVTYVRRFLQMEPVAIDACVSADAGIWPGYTALHFAVANYRYKTYELLLEYKADVGARTARSLTMLHLVCEMDAEQLDRLLNEAVPPEQEVRVANEERISQFFASFRELLGNRLCLLLNLLGKGCEVEARDDDGNVALMYAVSNNSNFSDISSIIEGKLTTRYEDLTAVKSELDKNQVILINHLFKQLNCSNKRGYTCMHNLTSLIYRKDVVAKHLLEYGGDVSVLNEDFASPLHLAVTNRQTFFVRRALESNETRWRHMANVNAQDMGGNTPLHLAKVIDENGKVNELLCLLLLYGADADIENEEGSSVFSFVYEHTLKAIVHPNFRLAVNQYENTFYLKYKAGVGNLEVLVDVTFVANAWKYFEMLRLWQGGEDRRLPANFASALSAQLHVTEESIGDRDNFRRACEDEVRRIREIRLNPDQPGSKLTLYSALVPRVDKVMEYTSHPLLRAILESPELKVQFPNYGYLLRAKFLRALIRKELMEKSIEPLCKMIDNKVCFSVTRSCAEKILGYLSENKLRVVIAVGSQLPDRPKSNGEVSSSVPLRKRAIRCEF